MFNDFPEKTEFFDIISRNYEFYEDIFVADHTRQLRISQLMEK